MCFSLLAERHLFDGSVEEKVPSCQKLRVHKASHHITSTDEARQLILPNWRVSRNQTSTNNVYCITKPSSSNPSSPERTHNLYSLAKSCKSPPAGSARGWPGMVVMLVGVHTRVLMIFDVSLHLIQLMRRFNATYQLMVYQLLACFGLLPASSGHEDPRQLQFSMTWVPWKVLWCKAMFLFLFLFDSCHLLPPTLLRR